MAAKRMKLSRVFCCIESGFGVEPDSDGSDYKFIKASDDATFVPSYDVIERNGLINDLTRIPHVIGPKGGQISFKVELKGSGTPGAGIPSIAAEADLLLTALLGTVARGTGSTITTGATTTSLPVASAAGFSKYMLVYVNCGATYGYVPRWITDITGSTLTVDRALPAAPADGANVNATSKYTRANSGHSSLAIAGERDGVLWTFLGCKFDTAKISGISARGLAVLDVQLSCSDWHMTAKASLPTAFAAAINLVAPPVHKAACFAIGGTEELLYGLDFDFAQTFAFQDSTCALGPGQPNSANAGLTLTESKPAGNLKAYYAASHLTDGFAGTERSLAFATPGASNGWGLYVPKAQFGQIGHEDHDGQFGETLPFMVNDNGSDPDYVLCLA